MISPEAQALIDRLGLKPHPNEGGFYVETYRGIRDANTLANIQNRYSVARAELLEPRLPATIEGAIRSGRTAAGAVRDFAPENWKPALPCAT